jgi:hypothetical protein
MREIGKLYFDWWEGCVPDNAMEPDFELRRGPDSEIPFGTIGTLQNVLISTLCVRQTQRV